MALCFSGPASSEYGYADRRLPDLPHLRREHTTPKWVSSHQLGDGPANDNTSIYVSMSRLDALHRQGAEVANPKPDPSSVKAEPTAEGEELGDDGMGPCMRSDRSESVYSNCDKEAIERAADRARTAESVTSARSG